MLCFISGIFIGGAVGFFAFSLCEAVKFGENISRLMVDFLILYIILVTEVSEAQKHQIRQKYV